MRFLKECIFVVFVLCSLKTAIGQLNYISNPSFEEIDTNYYYYPDSTYWIFYSPSFWFTPTNGGGFWYRNSNLNSVDTTSFGLGPYGVPRCHWDYCMPVEGDAFAMIFAYYPPPPDNNEGNRNYLENQLNTPLQANVDYCLSFYITLIDSSQISINEIGVVFSSDSITNYNEFGQDSCYLHYFPDIISPQPEFFSKKNKWYFYSGVFHASGGEKYMTIGNFKPAGYTNYVWVSGPSIFYTPAAVYNVDLVTLYECDFNIHNANAGPDATICAGDSIRLGVSDSLSGYTFHWNPSLSVSDSTIQNPRVAPESTTTYTLEQTYYGSYISTDEVTITVENCNDRDSAAYIYFVPNVFSPNADGVNDYFRIQGQKINSVTLQVFNRWGVPVFQTDDLNASWDGRFKGADCAEGVYYYYSTIGFADGKVLSARGSISLIR